MLRTQLWLVAVCLFSGGAALARTSIDLFPSVYESDPIELVFDTKTPEGADESWRSIFKSYKIPVTRRITHLQVMYIPQPNGKREYVMQFNVENESRDSKQPLKAVDKFEHFTVRTKDDVTVEETQLDFQYGFATLQIDRESPTLVLRFRDGVTEAGEAQEVTFRKEHYPLHPTDKVVE